MSFHFSHWIQIVLCIQLIAYTVDSTRVSPPNHTNEPISDTSAVRVSSQTASKLENCTIILPSGTQYEWRFAVNAVPRTAPTNGAGTQTQTIHFTTGMLNTAGTWKFQTTHTVITFPTPFTVNADRYTWLASSKAIKNFFSTVGIYPQQTAFNWSTLAPSGDLGGLRFSLRPTMTSVQDMAYYRSKYPDIAALEKCKPTTPVPLIGQPPGILNIGTEKRPTFPGTFDASSTQALSGSKGIDAFSTTLSQAAPLISKTSDPRSNISTPSSKIQTHGTASPFPAEESRTATRSLPPGRHTHSGHHHVVSTSQLATPSLPTIPQSSSIFQPSGFISNRNGTVLVDGHGLKMNSTLIVGSGPVETVVVMKTDSAGRTVVYAHTTTTASSSGAFTSSSVASGFPPPPAVSSSVARSSTGPSSAVVSAGVSGRKFDHLIPLILSSLTLFILFWI